VAVFGCGPVGQFAIASARAVSDLIESPWIPNGLRM
jgi:threonine dehydrogenase-like Zn-dependent dehydrogenase